MPGGTVHGVVNVDIAYNESTEVTPNPVKDNSSDLKEVSLEDPPAEGEAGTGSKGPADSTEAKPDKAYVCGDCTRAWTKMSPEELSTHVPASRTADLPLYKIAARETHCMLIKMTFGYIWPNKEEISARNDIGVPKFLQKCFLKYNPLYWFCWLGIASLIFMGQLVHYPLDQHRRTRKDETELEGEVRIQWIYCCDGCYALMILYDIGEFFFYWADDGLTWNSTEVKCGANCYLVALAIYSGLLATDCLFLNAMKQQNELMFRGSIVTVLLFGVVVLICLLISALTGNLDDASDDVTFSWFMRVCVVLMYVVMGMFYCKLWHVYRPTHTHGMVIFDADRDGQEDDCKTHMTHCSICKVSGPALVVLGILIFGYATEPVAVWNALA